METADLLDGSVPAADSALQRARATMGRHRDRTADASPAPAEVVPPPGGRWTPPPGDVGTLVMVVAGTTTLFAGSRAATFDAGSMLPFTPATDLGLHNRTRAPVTIVTLTRDGSRMRP